MNRLSQKPLLVAPFGIAGRRRNEFQRLDHYQIRLIAVVHNRYQAGLFCEYGQGADHAAALSDNGPRLRRGDVLINQSELIPLNAFDAAIMIRSGQYSGGIEFDSFHWPTLTGGHGSVSVRK